MSVATKVSSKMRFGARYFSTVLGKSAIVPTKISATVEELNYC